MKYILPFILALAFLLPVSAGATVETSEPIECEEGEVLVETLVEEAKPGFLHWHGKPHYKFHWHDAVPAVYSYECVEDPEYVPPTEEPTPEEECVEAGGEWIDEECVYPPEPVECEEGEVYNEETEECEVVEVEPSPSPAPPVEHVGSGTSGFNVMACTANGGWIDVHQLCPPVEPPAPLTVAELWQRLAEIVSELLRIQGVLAGM